jgi:hypothetical protein
LLGINTAGICRRLPEREKKEFNMAANVSLTWTEFSLEWLGRASGEIVASVMEVCGGKWLITLNGVNFLRPCDSPEEAKSIAESLYRERLGGTIYTTPAPGSGRGIQRLVMM